MTLTLLGLERDGLVTRTVFPTIPPRLDYELTSLGRSLLEPVSGLGLWAAKPLGHRDRPAALRRGGGRRLTRRAFQELGRVLTNRGATDQGAFDVRHAPDNGAKADIADFRVGP